MISFLFTFTFALVFALICSNWWSQLPCCKVPYGEVHITRIEDSLKQIASKEVKPAIQNLQKLNSVHNHQLSLGGSWILFVSDIVRILDYISMKFWYDCILDDTLMAGSWESLSLRTQLSHMHIPVLPIL